MQFEDEDLRSHCLEITQKVSFYSRMWANINIDQFPRKVVCKMRLFAYFLNTVILGWSLQEKYSWVSSKVEEEATEAQFHFKELQAEFEELLSKETFDASVKIHDLLSDAEILKPNDLLCFCNIFFYASTWYSKDAQRKIFNLVSLQSLQSSKRVRM